VSARLLVVDDNRSNLDLMLYLLRAFGHQAEGVNDGLAGIEAARQAEFDAILVDILMPGIDGYEFARRFKADPLRAETPLIAVTALAMVGDRERILSAGFSGYITKPIDPQVFVGEVESYLPQRLRTAKGHAETQAKAAGAAPPSGPIVLAVDDIAANLELIRAALEPFGYRIVDARSVDEAIELLDRVRPAIVLCDLHMPRRDGFDLIMRVRADPVLAELPFIFISSTSWHTADRRRGLELGAQKFLMRPIEPAKLRAEIEQLIAK
jgi:two-component system cell cycle response regulator